MRRMPEVAPNATSCLASVSYGLEPSGSRVAWDSNPPKWASSPQFAHSADLGDFHFYALSQ